MEHLYVNVSDLRFHVVQSGTAGGPLVILLHGFPEFWGAWKAQIPALASLGFRVWAPDQRGYNLSDKPIDVAAYNIDDLVGDVIGLIEAAGRAKAVLIGHDWGAAVAWRVARRFPERLERLVILNQAHGAVFRKFLREDAAQRRKIRYFAYFQPPWLPEKLLALGNYALLIRWLRGSGRPETFDDTRLVAYREAWSRPGAMRSMLNWYRAIRQTRPRARAPRQVTVPTLLVWGKKDRFLGWQMAEPSLEYCEDGRLFFLDEASHWLHHEEPGRVNELIGEFLAGSAP